MSKDDIHTHHHAELSSENSAVRVEETYISGQHQTRRSQPANDVKQNFVNPLEVNPGAWVDVHDGLEQSENDHPGPRTSHPGQARGTRTSREIRPHKHSYGSRQCGVTGDGAYRSHRQPRDSPSKVYGSSRITGGLNHFGDHYYVGARDEKSEDERARVRLEREAREAEVEARRLKRFEEQRRLEEQRKIDNFAQSFRFYEMNLRINQVPKAHAETYEWIFKPLPAPPKRRWSDFSQWLQDDAPIYWIFGKPGSGKSTMMKFIASHPTTTALLDKRPLCDDHPEGLQEAHGLSSPNLQSYHIMPIEELVHTSKDSGWVWAESEERAQQIAEERYQGKQFKIRQEPKVPPRRTHILLSFFFWLSGQEHQRSLKGCLCTLLYQLTTADRTLVKNLLQTNQSYAQKKWDSDWSEQELSKLLLQSLSATHKPFCIFLDGLDEFDRQSDIDTLFDMVNGISKIRGAKICVSSRQELEVQQAFSMCPQLRLQDLTKHDIEKMARDKLIGRVQQLDLKDVTYKAKEDIIKKLVKMAQGVFLWAILAIRSLLIGLKSGDNISVLHRRMTILPPKMTELYEQMWDRLQEDQKLYSEESRLHFALAEQLPMSLLDFTLAVDTCLLKECTSSDVGMHTALLERIIEACRNMVVKIHKRTAGLLETVNDWEIFNLDEDEKLQDLCKFFAIQLTSKGFCSENVIQRHGQMKYPLCSCIRAGWQRNTCLMHENMCRQIRYIHGTQVQFMHRTVAEFLKDSEWSDRCLKMDKAIRGRAWQGSAIARIATYTMGCECLPGIWLESLLVDLSSDLLEEAQLDLLATMIMRTGQSLPRRFGNIVCQYGWSHFLSKSIAPRIARTSNQLSSHYYDFAGLLASIGCTGALKDFLASLDLTVGSYYMAYLLVCAFKGLQGYNSIIGPRWEHRMETVRWLLNEGVDIMTDHVIPGYMGGSVIIRKPFVEAQVSLLRYLVNHGTSPNERTRVVEDIASRLPSAEGQLEASALWCVGTSLNDFELDLLLPDSGLEHHTVILEIKIADIQRYILDCVSRAAEKHGDHRAAIAPLRGFQAIIVYHATHDDYATSLEGEDVEMLCEALDSIIKDLLQHGQCQAETTMAWSDIIKTELAGAKQRDSFLWNVNCRKGLMLDFGSDYRLKPFAVPPDYYNELDASSWYEHGELREWHEQRRRGLIEGKYVKSFEIKNNLIPSYEPGYKIPRRVSIRQDTTRKASATTPASTTRLVNQGASKRITFAERFPRRSKNEPDAFYPQAIDKKNGSAKGTPAKTGHKINRKPRTPPVTLRTATTEQSHEGREEAVQAPERQAELRSSDSRQRQPSEQEVHQMTPIQASPSTQYHTEVVDHEATQTPSTGAQLSPSEPGPTTSSSTPVPQSNNTKASVTFHPSRTSRRRRKSSICNIEPKAKASLFDRVSKFLG